MSMPVDILFMRHGESVGNQVKRMMEKGDHSAVTQEFRRLHSTQYPLTSKGVEQIAIVGKWLRDNGLNIFDRHIASNCLRAMGSAGTLGLEGAGWYIDPFLRERDYGQFDFMPLDERVAKFPDYVQSEERDGFFWSPPGGESIAGVAQRLRPLFDTLHRECEGKRVIVVCHGEVMWAVRVLLERMSLERYAELKKSKNPHDRIHNGQILHYSRRDPVTGDIAPHCNWMRSVCPTNLTLSSNEWKRIVRPVYSNEELLRMAGLKTADTTE